MKVIRSGQTPKQDTTNAPIFTGGKVSAERMIGPDSSKYYNFGIVSFEAGARNYFHTHTSDQVLFVTSGAGIVATQQEEAEVKEGDTILIPAGEKHWHGATPASAFAHITLTAADSKTEIFPQL